MLHHMPCYTSLVLTQPLFNQVTNLPPSSHELWRIWRWTGVHIGTVCCSWKTTYCHDKYTKSTENEYVTANILHMEHIKWIQNAEDVSISPQPTDQLHGAVSFLRSYSSLRLSTDSSLQNMKVHYTTAHHWSLSWARCIQSTPSQ